jgi:hypothetical protein
MARLPRDVEQAIKRQAPKLLKKDLNKEFKKKFDLLKEEMIKDFLLHPVTVEIKAGPNSTNISGTLGGKANLFAFIGFNAGEDPTKPILDLLQKITYKESGDSKKGVGKEFYVNLPNPSDIFAITPMPWASGRSWAKGIETGISGVGYLLNKSTSSSRSGVAIQTENKVRRGGFKNLPYISELIRKYEKKFNNLK